MSLFQAAHNSNPDLITGEFAASGPRKAVLLEIPSRMNPRVEKTFIKAPVCWYSCFPLAS